VTHFGVLSNNIVGLLDGLILPVLAVPGKAAYPDAPIRLKETKEVERRGVDLADRFASRPSCSSFGQT
jgi:hypothetical protein